MTTSDPQHDAPATPGFDAFEHSGAAALLAAHPDTTLHDLAHRFHEAASAADAESKGEAAKMLRLIGGICSMMLQPSSKTAPLAPVIVWADGRSSLGPDHLDPDQVDLLAQLVEHIDHVPLRARMADLVWMKAKHRGHQFALRAIDDYRSAPIEKQRWPVDGRASWQRALQLAVPLKTAAGDRVIEIEDALAQAFSRAKDASGQEPLGYLRPLMDERRGLRHAPKIAEQLEHLARQRITDRHTFDAADYLEAARSWFQWARNEAKAAEMQVLLAQVWTRHADGESSALVRHDFYRDAITAYRAVPARFRGQYGVDQALAEARAKYEEAGQLSLGEMQLIKGPSIDLTPLVTAAVEHVKHPDPLDALSAFCGLDSWPKKAQYIQEAEELLNQSVLGRLIGSVTIAGDGRAIARDAGADSTEEAHQAKLENKAMETFLQHAGITAHGMINPALDQIREQHLLTLEDFRALAGRCGIVPADRADIVGQGLFAGYCRDLVQAIHILMPQFEHMVREILKQDGVLTTTHDKEGLDMEIGLSNLSERPQMTKLFGENLTFAIRSLMCVQVGPNLRNAVAHGQADSALCQGPHGQYAWWLILRLVVNAFRQRWGSQPRPAGEALENE